MMPGWSQNSTWISRKQCVMAAIENQLSEFKKSHPNKKIGLVVFNDEVIVVGDSSKDPLVIAGDKLNNKEQIIHEVKTTANQILSKPISETSESLIDKCQKLKEKGQTALGPALLASLELALNGKPGSLVVICTDGLANIGLG